MKLFELGFVYTPGVQREVISGIGPTRTTSLEGVNLPGEVGRVIFVYGKCVLVK